jgi:hypothetical protein
MSSAGIVQPTPDATPRMGVGAQLANIFFAPSKTFAEVKRAGASWPTIIAAWLLISASMLALAYVVQVKIGFDTVAENRMRRMPKIQQMMERMPEEQRAKALADQPASAQRNAYMAHLWTAVIFLIVSALQMATFNFGFGAKFSFKTCIAIVTLSGLPGIVRNLLAIVSIYAGVSPEGFNFDAPIASNLGALFDVATHPYLATFGSFMDLFMFWTLGISALGFAVVGGIKFGRALIPVVGWYLLFVLAIFGLFAAFLL